MRECVFFGAMDHCHTDYIAVITCIYKAVRLIADLIAVVMRMYVHRLDGAHISWFVDEDTTLRIPAWPGG